MLSHAFADIDYPIASIIVISAFLFLLAIEHITTHLNVSTINTSNHLTTPSIPIIMTVMIAIPSFFLGTALGVSETFAAVFIWVAIAAHKSSTAFALALKMVRSTLSKKKTILIFSLFAFSTPLGIIVGQDIHRIFSQNTMIIIKGTVLSLAAGTFLYMSTLHELGEAPLIKQCGKKKGFIIMLAGFYLPHLSVLL